MPNRYWVGYVDFIILLNDSYLTKRLVYLIYIILRFFKTLIPITKQ